MPSTPGLKVMRRLDSLRAVALKGKPMPHADLAQRAGLSRATWFNYLNGTYELTIDAAAAFSHALKANFGVIVGEQDAVSGEPARVAAQHSTGDLTLSDPTAQLVAFMQELDEPQQERVLKMVMNAIALTGGFPEPGADEGSAARKK